MIARRAERKGTWLPKAHVLFFLRVLKRPVGRRRSAEGTGIGLGLVQEGFAAVSAAAAQKKIPEEIDDEVKQFLDKITIYAIINKKILENFSNIHYEILEEKII